MKGHLEMVGHLNMAGVPPVTVLLYHEILGPGQAPNADVGCIPVETFDDHLEAMAAAGFQIVSLGEALEAAVSATPDSSQNRLPRIAITFDDGYAHLHRFLPRIVQRVPVTLFVIQEYLGKSNLDWNVRAPVILHHLTLDQVNDLASLGVEIETHGPDHHNLVKFRENELRSRFRSNVEWFCDQFRRPPRYTAYPYGACNDLVREVAEEFFEGALSVNHGEWQGPGARFALNRISVPSYLHGRDLVEVIATPAETRWAEIERRAPWRQRQ